MKRQASTGWPGFWQQSSTPSSSGTSSSSCAACRASTFSSPSSATGACWRCTVFSCVCLIQRRQAHTARTKSTMTAQGTSVATASHQETQINTRNNIDSFSIAGRNNNYTNIIHNISTQATTTISPWPETAAILDTIKTTATLIATQTSTTTLATSETQATQTALENL